MTTLFRRDIDWTEFKHALGDVPTIDNPRLLQAKSRDFYWYSPSLKRKLYGWCADLVAQPRTVNELQSVIKLAHSSRVPITLRGRGSGNYGQAVPLEGGLIIEMTRLGAILEIAPGSVRVEAGCNVHQLNEALRAEGQELPIFSSTQRIATIGGFIGGGSSGIGSIEHGPLRELGNIIEIGAMSVGEEPVIHRFRGADVNLIHHAWGMNGVIVDITLKTAPRRDWVNCIASFDSYRATFEAGLALGERTDLHRKLISTVDASFTPFFVKLKGRLREGRHHMLSLIDRPHVDAFRTLVAEHNGRVELALDETEMADAKLPHVFEFAYNHTTLQVLNVDKTVTYLQVTVPPPIDVECIDRLRETFGDEVLMHHEFSRYEGKLYAADLPVVRYTTDERLYEIMDEYEREGCPVADPHTYLVEDSGMKGADYRHLAWKKRLDPQGLLNPGKSKAWDNVKHLSAEEIEALQVGDVDLGSPTDKH